MFSHTALVITRGCIRFFSMCFSAEITSACTERFAKYVNRYMALKYMKIYDNAHLIRVKTVEVVIKRVKCVRFCTFHSSLNVNTKFRYF